MKLWSSLPFLVATLLVATFLVATPRVAHADVFAFKNLEGFEKCLQLDHLVEKVNTADGSQTRLLDPVEIQLRCVDAAVKLAAAKKDKGLTMEFVTATKRLSGAANAIDLTGVLTELSIATCNDMPVYEVFLAALAYSQDNTFYPQRVRRVVKHCLKDKEFRKDFLEEQDNADAHIAGNACRILLEEKLVKACKGSK